MAALRHLFLRRLTPTSSALLRPFSSSSPIKPVSYAVKPKDPEPSPPPEAAPRDPPPEAAPFQAAPPRDDISRQWTRADARYVRDGPISPVSYPARVAPLPEDKPRPAEEEMEVEGEQERKVEREHERKVEVKVEEPEELQREARVIRRETQARSYFRGPEEVQVPYPTMFLPEKRPQKVAMELSEAIRRVKANANRNFLETVEAHVNLGVNPRRGDQMVRGAITLPHGTGKTVRVAVFAEGPAAEAARAAGADVVGGDDLIEQIKNGGGKLNFDKCIATPMFMPRLSKIARILGPRGLMPNPKLGSVTNDVSGAVKEAKCGRIDFKIDKTAIVHVGLGKVNFSEESLRENIGTFVNALLLAKPVGLKKTSKYAGYVKSFTLCSTMGPGFPVSITSISAAADNFSKQHVK